MPRPLRMFEPDGVYFVTGRCLQSRLLMRPSTAANRIIGGVLARAISIFHVDVFAFVFVSNHFHMLVRSTNNQIPSFMQYLRSNIAKKLGANVDWRGKFWDRRYDAEPVLDDDALLGRLRYVLAHGVKEGLVSRCRSWPGLSSIPELLDNEQRCFAWPTANHAASSDSPERRITLRIATLPCWNGNSPLARRQKIAAMIADIEDESKQEQRNTPTLGVRAVLTQDPHSRPRTSRHDPRPLCHASTRAARIAYEMKHRAYVDAYREASSTYRAGNPDAQFPPFAFRPPGGVVSPRRRAA